MNKKLNLNDYNALNHILLFNNMSRTLLASELEISAPAVFKIIKKLVAKKFNITGRRNFTIKWW